MRSQPEFQEAQMHADPDDELAELRQRVAALERHTLTLAAALDWFGRWETTGGERVTSLPRARIATGLAAVAEEDSGVGRVFDRAGDGARLVVHPDLAGFLQVAEWTQVGKVTAAFSRRMMLALPATAAGRHKIIALADALERLCTSAGAWADGLRGPGLRDPRRHRRSHPRLPDRRRPGPAPRGEPVRGRAGRRRQRRHG